MLDTNVISELAKPAPDPAVVTWANAQPPGDLYTTVIIEAEVLFVLACLPSGQRQDNLRRAVETAFTALLSGRILSFDRAAAQAYAALAVERRREGRVAHGPDLQIAAIARARSAGTIATRNTRDFQGCGVPLVNPWQSGMEAGGRTH